METIALEYLSYYFANSSIDAFDSRFVPATARAASNPLGCRLTDHK